MWDGRYLRILALHGSNAPLGSALACDDATTQMLINVLNFIPDGVVKMSNDIKGLVQTSLNLGVTELTEKTFAATYLIRSSSQSEKEYLTDKVGKMTEYLLALI